MLHSLYSGEVSSHDGADQGFLVSYFPDMLSSPLFDPLGDFSNHETVRLPIGYNMNHFYYYEKGNWDNGWRQGQFKHLRIPAYSLGFPSPADLKVPLRQTFYFPFYFTSFFFLSVFLIC
jgi:hypothetical protein